MNTMTDSTIIDVTVTDMSGIVLTRAEFANWLAAQNFAAEIGETANVKMIERIPSDDAALCMELARAEAVRIDAEYDMKRRRR